MERRIVVALSAAGVILALASNSFASGAGAGRMGGSMGGSRPTMSGAQGSMNRGAGTGMPAGTVTTPAKGPGMVRGIGAAGMKMGASEAASVNQSTGGGATGSSSAVN